MDSSQFDRRVFITALLGTQALCHMGVVMALLPTKGLPLPFVSYGGTSLVVSLFLVGVLLYISAEPRLEEGAEDGPGGGGSGASGRSRFADRSGTKTGQSGDVRPRGHGRRFDADRGGGGLRCATPGGPH